MFAAIIDIQASEGAGKLFLTFLLYFSIFYKNGFPEIIYLLILPLFVSVDYLFLDFNFENSVLYIH